MKHIEGNNWSGANNSVRTGENGGSDYLAPLGTIGDGRLVFASGAQWLALRAGKSPRALLEAGFRRDAPQIWLQDGVVTVKYLRLPLLEQLASRRRPAAVFRLNDSIPWEIEFHGGVSHLDGDLVQVQLRSLDILGGASRLRLRLSTPAGHAFVYIAGGVSDSAIVVPAATGIRVHVSGGVSKLSFDGQHFGALSAETRVQSPGFESATDRYEIYIADGASNLRIERKALP